MSLAILSSTFSIFTVFLFVERYLGDQRFSYNRYLTFTLRVGDAAGARASIIDVVLEGSGQKVSGPIFAAGNQMPGVATKSYRFRLHENREYQWSPRLNAQDFVAVLSNLTAIKIRGTYTPEGERMSHEDGNCIL